MRIAGLLNMKMMKCSWIVALLLLFSCEAFPCEIEYSDWLIAAMKSQGLHLEKRIGSYANLAECKGVVADAVRRSGDPNLGNHMYCVECDDAESASPSPASEQTTEDNRDQYATGSPDDLRNGERKQAFEAEKAALIRSMKGSGNASAGLILKTAGGSGSGLALKRGDAKIPPAESDNIREEEARRKVKEAKQKIASLQQEIFGIQGMLRQYTKSLANNASEFETWGKYVDAAYSNILNNSKEYLLGLFLEYNLLGRFKNLQKESFGKVDGLIHSQDPKIKDWLGKELGGRKVNFEQLEKLVKTGQAEADFAAVLHNEGELRRNLDALILINDLLEIAGRSVPGGGTFQHARMIGETYTDLASIGYSWFSINRLEKDTDKMSREVDSLGFRMRLAMKQVDCLKGCLESLTEQCMNRCTGRNRLSTPPPLPR